MHLENPGKAHWKGLARIMGYLKAHYQPLKLRAPKALLPLGHVDSDWGSDRNDRKSISSYLSTIGSTCLVNFQSKKQNTVALSSTEAELYAKTSAIQDLMFIRSLLTQLTNKDPSEPSQLFGDNMGAIFLAGNLAVGQQTKHINIRTRFVTNLVHENKVKIEHQRSEDNPADIGSKNCKEELHNKHARNIYDGRLEPVNREDVKK